jgi:hypothetical protein
MWRAHDRLNQPTQTAWERSRNIIRKRRVRDPAFGPDDMLGPHSPALGIGDIFLAHSARKLIRAELD